jgi:hypothetical protein
MRPYDDDAVLANALRALRPELEPQAAARLDGRIAALRTAGPRLAPLSAWRRFRAAPLRRQLAPVLAGGIAAIAVTTALVAGSGGSSPDRGNPVPMASAPATAPPAPSSGAAGTAAGGPDAAVERSAAPAAIAPTPVPAPPPGGFAAGERRRFNETSAQLTLGTDPDRVHAVSDQVFSVVRRYDGIVLASSINDGPAGQAGAQFSLLVPSAKLSDALANLSTIADVRSRSDNSLDITAPVVSTQEHLRDARAEVEGLLKQLASADTDAERAAVKAQLRFQHRRVAALRSTLAGLRHRANLSRVSVDVVTGDAIGFTTGGDGQWTIGDAVHDAGRVLAVAAGVALVGLAALAPLAILALVSWAAFRAWIRASRERALRGSGVAGAS